jgi:hypothetical protein
MTRTNAPEPDAPETPATESSSCGACGRSLRRAPTSRVFPTWHERCLERAVWEARAEVRED